MKNQNQKGISSLLSIIIIIVVGVVVVGGVLVYQYWWAPEKEAEVATPKVEAPKDETADWKTYRNEGLGFEIKYPSELTLTFKEHVPPHGTDLIINGKVSAYDGDISSLSLSFNVFPTTINDLEKYVEDKVADSIAFHERWNEEHPSDLIEYGFNSSKITMGNAIGYVAKYEFPNSGQDNTEIFTQNSKNLIRILYDSSDNEKVMTIQKILSTFRFIE